MNYVYITGMRDLSLNIRIDSRPIDNFFPLIDLIYSLTNKEIVF